MNKILQDIWILTNSGTVLWSRVYDAKMDDQLFGALMSAVNTFAKQISNQGLTTIELTDKTFVLHKKEGLLFITNAPIKTHKKRIKRELQWIADKFIQTYSNDLEFWNKDTLLFSDFKNIIENSLEDPIDKLKKSFW
ncbi:MAG: hypothetical protein EU541_04735 [Promethearchaeota archaeon]|nr:MAG: hypothetical protein EU541_04735 [Candidatus Lokiarchaeota archaeon]